MPPELDFAASFPRLSGQATNLSEQIGASAAGADVLDICRSALELHAIQERDVLATLLFGSSAKGLSKTGSDLDVIFFIEDRPGYPAFSYRPLQVGDVKVDCNVIKPAALNQACRADVGWGYRLHRPVPVAELSTVPAPALAAWIDKLDAMIGSGVACRYRLLRHTRDCRTLLIAARQFASAEPGLAAYLILESVFLVPIIFLNYCRIVPFQRDVPWNEALHAADAADPTMAASYQSLLAEISRSQLFRSLAGRGSFAQEIKHLRDKCRAVIARHEGSLFGNGYRLLVEALRRNAALRRELSRLAVPQPTASDRLAEDIWQWTNLVRERQRARKLPGRGRTPVRRKRGHGLGPRHLQFHEEASRLKIIMPTGGCRVPTCTFCMLPALARSKASVDEAMAALKALSRAPSLRQLTIYTDGSFFDSRELNDDERRLIAETTRELGAEELLVESLPRFLSPQAVEDFRAALGPACRLRIGIGVQSTAASVRRYVTRTPITQHELLTVLQWRKTAPFSLRCYLLANKPMMSAAEDREDVRASLQFLERWLTDADTVTVNPLLPTEGTVVENLSAAGLWRPLRADEAQALQADLQADKYTFRLEFGPISVATCTDLDLNAAFAATGDATAANAAGLFPPTDPAFLPWAVLGGMRHRNHWATRQRTEAGSPTAARRG
jgi:radical SAM enzyme (TIGR01210 family)